MESLAVALRTHPSVDCDRKCPEKRRVPGHSPGRRPPSFCRHAKKSKISHSLNSKFSLRAGADGVSARQSVSWFVGIEQLAHDLCAALAATAAV